MTDIQMPAGLRPVAYLAGSAWPGPPASELGMGRLRDVLHAAADALDGLTDALAGVRAALAAVLSGQTAAAADEQFHLLFDGDASVPRLGVALRGAGDLAADCGTELEYKKLSIISTLGIALATISWALANADWTMGASLAEIPAAEEATVLAIEHLQSTVGARVAAALAQALSKTMVRRLVAEGGFAAGLGAAQDLAIQAFQVGEGHRARIDLAQTAHSAESMGVAGLVGGMVGHLSAAVLGPAENLASGVVKGAVSSLLAGEAANIAANGGAVTPEMLAGGAIGFLHGALPHTHGAHSASTGHGAPVGEPTDSAVPDNAIAAHPTLRFEKQLDGTYAWPGEQTPTIHDPSGHTSDGPPQANTAAPPTPPADPASAPGQHATASPGANGSSTSSETGTKTSTGSTAASISAHGEVEGPSPGSVNAAPAAAHSAASPAGHPTAGIDAESTNISVGSGIPEGTINLSTRAVPVAVGPVADGGSLPMSDLAGKPAAVGVPVGTPDVAPVGTPEPNSTAPATSERGSNVGPPSSTSDARAGFAEPSSPAGQFPAQPAGAAAALSSDTTAAYTRSGTQHVDPERVEAGQTGGRILQRPTAPIGPEPAATGQIGRPGADDQMVGRGEGTRADSGRPADPLPNRRDPARPGSSRDDSSRPSGARPGKLPRHSGVDRDIPDDRQLAAVSRAPEPPATAKEIGVIKASHGDSGPAPREPESHSGSGDGNDGPKIPDPGTAGGGAGAYRGGDGGHRGGGGGGAGRAGAGLGDGGGASDPPDRGDGAGYRGEPGRDDFHTGDVSHDVPLEVSASIVRHTISGVRGGIKNSITGLITGVGAESRTAPEVVVDERGVPRRSVSLVLDAVEARGPNHLQLEAALNARRPLNASEWRSIESNGYTVKLQVRYRIFDAGKVQAEITYDHPEPSRPEFGNIRQMVDAALTSTFRGKAIELLEIHDFGDESEVYERKLGGGIKNSITGYVIAIGPGSRARVAEARGPDHAQLLRERRLPWLISIESNGYTVKLQVRYRIFDAGKIQAQVIYDHPEPSRPEFANIRQMVDVALTTRFPGKPIETLEIHDFGDNSEFYDRELGRSTDGPL